MYSTGGREHPLIPFPVLSKIFCNLFFRIQTIPRRSVAQSQISTIFGDVLIEVWKNHIQNRAGFISGFLNSKTIACKKKIVCFHHLLHVRFNCGVSLLKDSLVVTKVIKIKRIVHRKRLIKEIPPEFGFSTDQIDIIIRKIDTGNIVNYFSSVLDFPSIKQDGLFSFNILEDYFT